MNECERVCVCMMHVCMIWFNMCRHTPPWSSGGPSPGQCNEWNWSWRNVDQFLHLSTCAMSIAAAIDAQCEARSEGPEWWQVTSKQQPVNDSDRTICNLLLYPCIQLSEAQQEKLWCSYQHLLNPFLRSRPYLKLILLPSCAWLFNEASACVDIMTLRATR